MAQSGVYLIHNTINGKCYVGSTSNRVVRLQRHRYLLGNNKHHNPHLQAAWNKYGEKAFEFVWVCDIPVNQLLDEEQKLLDVNPDGYNIAKDAEVFARGVKWPEERKMRLSVKMTGRKHSTETRKKIGDVQRGKQRGPRTPEHRRKLSEAMKGKRNAAGAQRTVEYCQKLSDALKGNQNFLGKKHSEETLQKLRKAAKGRRPPISPEILQKRSVSLKAAWARRKQQTNQLAEAT